MHSSTCTTLQKRTSTFIELNISIILSTIQILARKGDPTHLFPFTKAQLEFWFTSWMCWTLKKQGIAPIIASHIAAFQPFRYDYSLLHYCNTIISIPFQFSSPTFLLPAHHAMKQWTRQAIASLHEPPRERNVLKQIVKSYHIDTKLLDGFLQPRVGLLDLDDGTMTFLDENPPSGRSKLIFDWSSGWLSNIAYNCLSSFVSHTDAIGLLGIGKMHVLSQKQFETVLQPHLVEFDSVLDIGKFPFAFRAYLLGAGDGEVTEKIAPLFSSVCTTEVSASMVSSLRNKGFMLFFQNILLTIQVLPNWIPKFPSRTVKA